MNKTIEEQIKELVDKASTTMSTGDLCMMIADQLEPGVQIRITQRGVRVTHSRYIDKLGSASEIDEALSQNRLALSDS